MVLYTGIALIVFSFVFALCAWVIRRRSDRTEMASKFRAEFLDSAHSLIRDERVPEEVARFSMALANLLLSPWPLRLIAWQLLFGNRNSKPAVFMQTVEKMPAELQTLFVKAVVLFGVAVTYNNVVLGFVFRRIFWVLSNSTVPKTTIADTRVRAIANDFSDRVCTA